MSSLKGTVVGHRYELLGLIAEGGQALICRARDRQTGQLVAVKMLTSVTAQNQEFVERLAREQEAMLTLAGTSAVAVFDLCLSRSGAPCLVMELLDGMDLEKYLCGLEARRERLALDRVVEIFDPIIETLERAHREGILHRDLKPANLFVLSAEAGGGVRLLDFGLARMKTAAPLTAMGTILGSPSYIAPEVWSGQPDRIDQRVDVYSLAVILFRVLGGRLPFAGETLHDKFMQTTTAPRPSLLALRPDLPREIDEWVQQALALEPAKRFPTVRALWNALLTATHCAPRARSYIPVPESVVSAWRAAAGAFRRVIAGVPAPAPSPSPPTAETRPRPEPSAEWIPDNEIFEEEIENFELEQILGGATAPTAQSPATDSRPAELAGAKRNARASRKKKRRAQHAKESAGRVGEKPSGEKKDVAATGNADGKAGSVKD